MADQSHRRTVARSPPRFAPRGSKKGPLSPAPLSPDSTRIAREKPDPVSETSAAPGSTHLRTPESGAGETLSDTPMDSGPKARRNKQNSHTRRTSIGYDSYRPSHSESVRRDSLPPPKASNTPGSRSDIGPTLNNGQPRARSPPKHPTPASVNDKEASRVPSRTTLCQSISHLASTITQAASISARRDLLAREALEQSDVYKSQLKHKDAFTTLFEEAAFRAAQAERSSRCVNDEMKEVQLAQNAAVERLTEILYAGFVTEKTQKASKVDQSSQKTREALADLQGSLDEIRIDIDFLHRNAVVHDDIDKKLAPYATKQQLRDSIPAKGQMTDKGREPQQASNTVKKHTVALDQAKSKLAELEEKKKYSIALDQVKSRVAELEQTSGKQDSKINAIEGQLKPVTTDLASHHARLTSIEQAPPITDQAVTTDSNLNDELAQTAEQAKAAEEDRVENMNQRLNALSTELQELQATLRRAEESAPSNSPDEIFDKAIETTVGHFCNEMDKRGNIITEELSNEMDKRGQIITEQLSKFSSNVDKVAMDLESLRNDVQSAQAQQQLSLSSSRTAIPTPPATSATVPATNAPTAPPPSLLSTTAPNAGFPSMLTTAPAQLAGPVHIHTHSMVALFQNMLEQHGSRSAGEVESLRLFVNGQQQRMDSLRSAVEQLYSVHPVQVGANINRIIQSQQYLEHQQMSQAKEVEALRKIQTTEMDPLKSQLESSQVLLKQLEGQVQNLSQSTSAFRIEQDGLIKDLVRDIRDSKNPVVELNERVNTMFGRTTIDILSLQEQIAALKSDKAPSTTFAAATNDRANSADMDSDEPMINRTRPSEKRTPIASITNNKRKAPFDSSDENEEPLASTTRKLDRVVRRMNVSKRGETTG